MLVCSTLQAFSYVHPKSNGVHVSPQSRRSRRYGDWWSFPDLLVFVEDVLLRSKLNGHISSIDYCST